MGIIMNDVTCSFSHPYGDTETPTLTITITSTGLPLDVSLIEIFLIVYSNPGLQSAPIISAPKENVDAVNGVIKFNLTPDQAERTGSYLYKILATSAGEQETLKYGKWVFV